MRVAGRALTHATTPAIDTVDTIDVADAQGPRAVTVIRLDGTLLELVRRVVDVVSAGVGRRRGRGRGWARVVVRWWESRDGPLADGGADPRVHAACHEGQCARRVRRCTSGPLWVDLSAATVSPAPDGTGEKAHPENGCEQRFFAGWGCRAGGRRGRAHEKKGEPMRKGPRRREPVPSAVLATTATVAAVVAHVAQAAYWLARLVWHVN